MLVNPIIDNSVRSLCCLPYSNHPKGCPNFNKRDTCPPNALLLHDILDLSKSIFVVYNAFAFGDHVDRMRAKHPEWSKRQLECCLYWQGTARKQLRSRIKQFVGSKPLKVLLCPEACGVNITATMLSIGVKMEWPPNKIAYQVALVGTAIE